MKCQDDEENGRSLTHRSRRPFLLCTTFFTSHTPARLQALAVWLLCVCPLFIRERAPEPTSSSNNRKPVVVSPVRPVHVVHKQGINNTQGDAALDEASKG